jgi:hypothetical protein
MIDKPTERSAGPVRFATFNLENLFARPKVFNLATWSAGAPILKAFADLNALIEKLTGPIGPPRHVVPS